jgi:hypothetical protein
MKAARRAVRRGAVPLNLAAICSGVAAAMQGTERFAVNEPHLNGLKDLAAASQN